MDYTGVKLDRFYCTFIIARTCTIYSEHELFQQNYSSKSRLKIWHDPVPTLMTLYIWINVKKKFTVLSSIIQIHYPCDAAFHFILTSGLMYRSS